MSSTQVAECPRCGSPRIKPIVYGMPAPDFDIDRFHIGGCVILPDAPTRHCDECELSWRERVK